MDDFIVRAALAGVGVALAAGPFGCVVVWRRMAFFGAALAHSALLGIALAFLLGIAPTLGIVALGIVLGIALILLERQRALANDTVLGILAHAALALGLVAIAFMTRLRMDLTSYLFGDVLAVTRHDVYVIYGMLIVTIGLLARLWRPLLSATVDADLAAVEGVAVARVRLVFVMLLACVVAIGMKVVGMLLIVSLLIIPAATARRFASSPEQMALGAAALGVLAVALGLGGSLRWDVPAGPMIVAGATLCFAASLFWRTPGGAARNRE